MSNTISYNIKIMGDKVDIDLNIKIHATLNDFWHLRNLTEEQILSILYRYSEDTDKFFHNYSKFYKQNFIKI